MTVEQLQAWLNKHMQDKNYQYRDLTYEEFHAKALHASANMLEANKAKVLKVCAHYGIPSDSSLIVDCRFMAQTNLFALCKLLGYNEMSEHEYTWMDGTVHTTHESICNSFFVRKDPTLSSFKAFALAYIDKTERLLLVPRGGFKSTMDMADCVQWVCNFPEVTIMILTGVLGLAEDFVKEIKGHFTLEDAGDEFLGIFAPKKNKKAYKARTMRDGTPSLFQVLFAEHCIPMDDGKAYEYQTPAVSQVEKESTVCAASIEQNLAGWHVCVLKLDDVVTNENSQTVDRIRNINKQVSINQAILHPFGFYDKIGTWYDSEDTYGQDIKNKKKFEDDGEDFPMKVYLRACWWPNAAAVAAGKIPEEMTKEDWGLWFGESDNPHALTYEVLQYKKKTDPWFAIKYLNDPTQIHVIKFPRELLVRRTIQSNLIPGTGMIVTAIDTAYSTKSWADYTVIITALIYGGKFYIIDMQRGRFNEYELPKIIAGTVLKWRPKRLCIEESVGVKWLGREIYREMDALRVRANIEFVSLGVGKKTNAKQIKAKPVLRLLGDERLLFSFAMPGKEEMYDELSKFGTAAATHDDIVDALAILVNQFSSYADMEARTTAQQADFNPDPFARPNYDRVYGLNAYAKLNAQEMQLENPDMSLADIVHNQQQDARETADPFADLFS